ncbi:hypothetical protein [Nocardia vinacea]|uniref:hypothetical protein n=1 Tax=Nocardia vinacea TaxID=96468 RepID=UPI00146EE847|nr:hypothetical protein [Nocardia vinacea]
MLLHTGKITEANVDVFDFLFLDVLDDLVGRAERHLFSLRIGSQPVSIAWVRRVQTLWTRCFPAIKAVFRQCYTCGWTGGEGHLGSNSMVVLPFFPAPAEVNLG